MKILKIEFRNINSLKGSHEIDFIGSPFTESSLFAITGPTGSGKSTILDVISLALFNQVPRLGKITKKEIISKGAILTRNQHEATAAVTYQSKNGIYRSQWRISTNRNNRLRDYEMEVIDLRSEKPLDLKKSDVPAKNEELIGLNYDQFIKSVLLAQGEFAQFLKAKKEERGELLEKITGTGIYRQLGIRAFQKHREVNREIEAQQNRIAAIKEQLLSTEQHTEYSEELKQKDCRVKELEKSIEALNRQLELKKKITDQLKQIQERQSQKTAAQNKLNEFETVHGLPLRQHEKIEPSAEDLRRWSQLKKDTSSLREEFQAVQDQKGQISVNLHQCLTQTEQLIKTPANSGEILDQLEAFSRQVSGLQQELRETKIEYRSKKDQLTRELQELEFQLNEQDPEESRAELKQLKNTSEEKILILKNKLKELDLEDAKNEKERLSEKLDLAREAWRKEGEIKNISSEMERLEKERQEFSSRMENYPAEGEVAGSKVALMQERLEKLETRRAYQLLQASFEEQRHVLKEGEPCPLCGSSEHPYAEHLPDKDDSLDKEFAETRKNLDDWRNRLSTINANFKAGKERLEKIKQQSWELKNKLETRKKEFAEKYGHLCPGEENPDWERMCHNWQEQVRQMQQLQDEQRRYSSILAGIPLLQELKEVLARGTSLKQQLEALYPGEDINRDTGKLSRHWTSLQQEKKNNSARLEELQKKITAISADVDKLEEDLFTKVKTQGFESIEMAREALMSETECRNLRNEREQLQSRITAVKSSVSLLHSQLEESKKADVSEKEEVLENTLQDNRTGLKKNSEECRELYSSLKNHAENLERMKKIHSEIAEKEEQIKRWRLLNELIGDSTGKKFNDFAQDLSLSQLLQLANVRLNDLSDRYRIDKPAGEEDDGLVAIDEHMGGQRRSVKTLSGGETFILSLSMALALSDLASKNVEINSLFIDEGFGTLDPETLDQTLDTLEKLQAESSKTIGIISHVDSLKERIATQIKLTRNGQGYSQLTVT